MALPLAQFTILTTNKWKPREMEEFPSCPHLLFIPDTAFYLFFPIGCGKAWFRFHLLAYFILRVIKGLYPEKHSIFFA